jgi:hypothetical protein
LSPLKFYQRAATACSTLALLAFAPQIHAITVVEYYNKSIDAHFLTGRAAEQAALDTVPDFQRTGMTFQAADAATAAAPLVPICRFYIAAASPYTSSHFYGRKGVDCESINAALPAGFTYEGFDFALPQPTAGTCAAGTTPIYRGFRNAAGGRTANHRYTASAETFDASASAGYSKEGVAFCASAATAATSTALAVTTAFGTGAVAATSKVITAAGDSIAVNGITVKAQRNQLSGATLSVQAISDTLNGGSGASLLITSNAPWKDRLVVSFPTVAGIDSADNTRIALQNADGTWQVLATFADATAGVLRALVPTPPANLSSASDSHLKAGALVSARLAKFDPFTLKPDGASVKVGTTQAFVAYARIDEERENEQLGSPTCQAARIAKFAAIDLDDELTPLLPTACVNQKITTDQPFKNNKAGYTRSWSLIGPGQIAPSGDTQGLYTAPGTKPTPDTAQVAFESKHIATGRAVIILGRIKIVTVIQGYSGTFRGGQQNVVFTGNVTLSRQNNELGPNGEPLYRVTAATANLTAPDPVCSTPGAVSLDIANSFLAVTVADSGQASYGGLLKSIPVPVTCKTESGTAVVLFGYVWFTCLSENNVLQNQTSSTATRLQGSCNANDGASFAWDFVAVP